MKSLVIPLAFVALVCTTAGASADGCYADYKAKQDNPLRLHYGVAQIDGPCRRGAARRELQSRLADQGWTLLNVLSVFGPEGLSQRKNSAGRNFLRF